MASEPLNLCVFMCVLVYLVYMYKYMGKQWKQCQTLFLGAPKSLQMVITAMELRHLLLARKTMTSLDSVLKSRDITFPKKGLSSQSYDFSSSHVQM